MQSVKRLCHNNKKLLCTFATTPTVSPFLLHHQWHLILIYRERKRRRGRGFGVKATPGLKPRSMEASSSFLFSGTLQPLPRYLPCEVRQPPRWISFRSRRLVFGICYMISVSGVSYSSSDGQGQFPENVRRCSYSHRCGLRVTSKLRRSRRMARSRTQGQLLVVSSPYRRLKEELTIVI